MSNPTIKELSTEWLCEKNGRIKESSYQRYQLLLEKHLVPELGEARIENVTDANIASFLKRLMQSRELGGHGLSERTVSDLTDIMKSIRQFAYREGIHPGFSAESMSVHVRRKQIRILSLEEEMRLFQYAGELDDPMARGVLLCMCTGIRIGELCALKWSDFSLRDRFVRISKTMQRLRDPDHPEKKTRVVISNPKSECSMRIIPLPECLLPKLSGQHETEAFFLTGKKEKFIEPRTVQYRFKRMLSACDIYDVNFHVLRHTFATRCIEKGCDVKSISEILGHADVKITMNIYVHPSLEQKMRTIDRASEYFNICS